MGGAEDVGTSEETRRAHFYTWSCMCGKQPGARVPNVLRRCAPYKGKALAPHGGYSCYVGGASRDSRTPKPRIAWSAGLLPRSILLVGISSQTLKTQNSRPRGRKFFGGAPVRALWFCVTAVTAVTMFYTFSLAVTAVTVVTCIYEFMGDSLCTYIPAASFTYVRTYATIERKTPYTAPIFRAPSESSRHFAATG